MREKSTQIFIITKSQNKVPNAFVNQQYWLILFLEYVKRNDDIKFLLIILMKKILMKKILMMKIKYRICLIFIFLLYSYVLRKKAIIFKVTHMILPKFITLITYITHITYITNIICITDTVKLIFKAYIKTKKDSEKKHVKHVKIFLKK